MTESNPPLPLPTILGGWKTILADPPWPEHGGGRIKRGADRHYPLLSIKEIRSLSVRGIIAENAHLYLWTTNNFLPDALQVMRTWGFEYRTIITWVKDRIGLGQYFRGITEHCLFGVRGTLPYRTNCKGKRAQGCTVIIAPKREHSRKPDELHAIIEAVSYPPYLELFARQRREGWVAWGLEVSTVMQLKLLETRNGAVA